MRKEFRLKHVLLSLMVVGLFLGLSSCKKDDDDKKKEEITVEAVVGSFSGKMNVAPVNQEDNLTATVTADHIVFNNFPVAGLVQLLAYMIPTEGFPPEMLATIQEVLSGIQYVDYQLPYTAAVNTAKDGLDITINAEPLELNIIPGVMAVKINVSSAPKGSYLQESKKLTFQIKALSLILNDGDPLPDFPELTISFDLTKQ